MDRVEKEEVVKKCTEMLENMLRDITIPRNIRKSAGEVKNKLLNGDESLAVRAAAAVSELEGLTNNPNIPAHTRTLVWSIVSQLETVSVEE
ncbi:MAG: UPF0147 family protein [Methanophagales archaeon]|nr:UPF0147 family protein [Methanophagales archaeon]MCW3141046.1 UPF0147 family protein [Methanophagales archaeon]